MDKLGSVAVSDLGEKLNREIDGVMKRTLFLTLDDGERSAILAPSVGTVLGTFMAVVYRALPPGEPLDHYISRMQSACSERWWDEKQLRDMIIELEKVRNVSDKRRSGTPGANPVWGRGGVIKP